MDLLVQHAGLLLIGAGAGWSADSGLATFQSAPEYRGHANPTAFRTDAKALRLWQQRALEYKRTHPHEGYTTLKRLASCRNDEWNSTTQKFFATLCAVVERNAFQRAQIHNTRLSESTLLPYRQILLLKQPQFKEPPNPLFVCTGLETHDKVLWILAQCLGCLSATIVITSNVDGHFQKCGFPFVFEVHGNSEMIQCVDALRCAARQQPRAGLSDRHLELCQCGERLRPNCLLFDDTNWIRTQESYQQEALYQLWCAVAETAKVPVTLLELGCGQTVPTIRREMYKMYNKFARSGSMLFRVNCTQSDAGFLDATPAVLGDPSSMTKRPRRHQGRKQWVSLPMSGKQFGLELSMMLNHFF